MLGTVLVMCYQSTVIGIKQIMNHCSKCLGLPSSMTWLLIPLWKDWIIGLNQWHQIFRRIFHSPLFTESKAFMFLTLPVLLDLLCCKDHVFCASCRSESMLTFEKTVVLTCMVAGKWVRDGLDRPCWQRYMLPMTETDDKQQKTIYIFLGQVVLVCLNNKHLI